MKRKNRKYLKALAALAVLSLFLGIFCSPGLPARAEEALQGEKTAVMVSEKDRTFRLDYRVWAKDWRGLEVVERLDPRFDLSDEERGRLKEEGASLTAESDGSWKIVWKPAGGDPWEASLTLSARPDFPGGNDVETDLAGTGLYRDGKEAATLTATLLNVPLAFSVQDFETELFLGQRVKLTVDGENVERAMLASPEPNWYGKSQTGSFSFSWETEDGEAVGSLKELERFLPERETSYRLRAVFEPASLGALGEGTPIKRVEKTALYKVKVTPGMLCVRAELPEGTGKDASFKFKIAGENGGLWYRTALPEADPEGGPAFLALELGGLPFGAYEVVPLSGSGLACREGAKPCLLGIWDRDDTISPSRSRARVSFKLEAVEK